jgi:hypothetical protein
MAPPPQSNVTPLVPAPAAAVRPASPPQKTYAIEILGATISPTKVGGAPWDGFESVPPEVTNAVSKALAATEPQAAVAVALAPIANKKLQPPDVAGTAELLVGGAVTQVQGMPKDQDDYMPSWHPGARFTGVVVDERTRIRVHLVDKDMGSFIGAESDDEIGTVYISERELRRGVAKGNVLQVRVDDQNSQILFIALMVYPE